MMPGQGRRGHAVRWSPDRVAELLGQAALNVTVRLLRGPGPGEKFQRGSLLARKPAGVAGR